MPDPTQYTDAARNFVIDILRRETSRTLDRIREVVEMGAKVAATVGTPFDVDAVTADMHHLFSVVIEDATVLDEHDSTAHVEWLAPRKADIEWRFWQRYMTFLERESAMAPSAVNALDGLTDMILGRLEDPRREGPWDRRGMVVGSVQSGKTANYTGLICKALDCDYKLIIILAGIHSNLRSQTQLRIDEGVLGFDTQKTRQLNSTNQIGVGRYSRPGEPLHIHSLTSSAENGDFNKRVAQSAGIMLGSDPVVLVVKKNSRLLGNLLQWILPIAAVEDPRTKKKTVPNVPLLLIDDEADNASINTTSKKRAAIDSDTVTAINGKIRDLLSAFEKSAYVGYTATPFANIFINPHAQTEKHGEDIFPRSFIVNVKPPSNYIGPARVFGLAGDPDAGITGQEALRIVCPIDDYATPACFPPKHKKDHVPTELPVSLQKAIRCFILACAARRARGQQTKHNSMLVHVTRFMDVQQKVFELVRDELLPLQRRIQFGDGTRTPTLRDELRQLWESEFVPVSQSLGDEAGPALTWDRVDEELRPAASKVTVMTINGSAKEALDYKNHEADGLSVIAIGGDKLSRGLTLEGLSTSYFLRTSRMYDTLMQMGRWFGYRQGYLDLCRLFTTPQLVDWYRHIALADVELRREFDYMVDSGSEPLQYGLRVRTHPGGMIVTALNKMCHSETQRLSWSGVLEQSTHVPVDSARVVKNLGCVERLVGELGAPRTNIQGKTRLWTTVPGVRVATFLEELAMPPESARAAGRQIADFIRKQMAKSPSELCTWTVALLSSTGPDAKSSTIGGYHVGRIIRTPQRRSDSGPFVSPGIDSVALKNANIISPSHQALDLKELPFTGTTIDDAGAPDLVRRDLAKIDVSECNNLEDVAIAITRYRIANTPLKGNDQIANGRVVRELRPRSRGLLLIYPLAPPSALFPLTRLAKGERVQDNGTGEPLIGVALSFPASASTMDGVEYRVNRVWDSEIQEDADYED
jgi:hypothetical protein